MLRLTLRVTLEDDFEVTECGSVDEAVALLEANEIDIVLCDLQMPRRTGMDLHEWASHAFPSLAILFMTGGATSETAHRFLSRPDIHSVQKPFEIEDLVARIQSLLTRPA